MSVKRCCACRGDVLRPMPTTPGGQQQRRRRRRKIQSASGICVSKILLVLSLCWISARVSVCGFVISRSLTRPKISFAPGTIRRKNPFVVLSSPTGGPQPLTYQEENDEDDDPKSSWMRWLIGGTPRGNSKVKFREAEDLGGLPRMERYASRDWFHSALTLPNSAILKDIRSPVVAMTSWATFLSLLHRKWTVTNPVLAHNMYFSPQPHSLMMSALGLLLVFRTNSAYQRFAEGRVIWEKIQNSSRDLYRMLMLYDEQIGRDKRRRVQRLLAAFPYLLRHRIRPNLVMRRLDDEQYTRDPENTILLYQDSGVLDTDPEAAAVASAEEETGKSRRKTRKLFWVDKRTLPWRLLPSGALEKCARAQNRPLWVCDRIAQELRDVPDQLPHFTNRERMTLITHVDKLSSCIGAAERLHQTVVPLNYARHTLRALSLWLVSLPFALVKELKVLTGPVMFLVTWMLFGVFEIGSAIEDPFQGSLRLSILCDSIRRDVYGDESIRKTAFELEQPYVPDDDKINGVNNSKLGFGPSSRISTQMRP